MAYLDYNAGAPVHASVVEAMSDALRHGGNPSSVHADGRKARAWIEAARERLAAEVGCRPRSIVWTSGGTEANALALAAARGRPVLVSAIEHASMLDQAPAAQRIPVTPAGCIDLEALERLLGQAATPPLVSVMAASNETGVIQPVAEVARLVRAAGGIFHCDGAQALGKATGIIAGLDAELITLSGHKIGAPAGVGALVARDPGVLNPLWRGGGQERGLRAGTEPLAAIAGMAAALDALAQLGDWQAQVQTLRDDLEAQLRSAVPDLVIHGQAALRLCNTSCIGLPGVGAETQVMALDLAGVAVSAGSACSSGKVRASPVLTAMGASPAAAGEAIRISLGWNTMPDDLTACVSAWRALAQRRRAA